MDHIQRYTKQRLRFRPFRSELMLTNLLSAFPLAFSLLKSLGQSFRLLVTALAVVIALWIGAIHDRAASHTVSSASNTPSIHLVGRLTMNLSPEQQLLFEEKTKALAAITRASEDIIFYSCNRDIEKAGTYVFDEAWPTERDLEKHLKTLYFLSWWEWVKPYITQDIELNIASLDAFHHLGTSKN